jgi:hypothetical protein
MGCSLRMSAWDFGLLIDKDLTCQVTGLINSVNKQQVFSQATLSHSMGCVGGFQPHL